MTYKVIAIFKVTPGKVDEELRRGRLTLEVLREQPGFIAYEAVRTGDDGVIVLQTWQTKEQFQKAMAFASQRRAAANEETIISSREFYAGEVVTLEYAK
jgi:heme-degrading monooxygenase HmoA